MKEASSAYNNHGTRITLIRVSSKGLVEGGGSHCGIKVGNNSRHSMSPESYCGKHID